MASAVAVPIKPAPQTQHSPIEDVVDSFGWLPCKVTVEIPVPGFTVGDLLRLQKGSIVLTPSPVAGDISFRINQLLLGRSQFEVHGKRLAIRVTEVV